MVALTGWGGVHRTGKPGCTTQPHHTAYSGPFATRSGPTPTAHVKRRTEGGTFVGVCLATFALASPRLATGLGPLAFALLDPITHYASSLPWGAMSRSTSEAEGRATLNPWQGMSGSTVSRRRHVFSYAGRLFTAERLTRVRSGHHTGHAQVRTRTGSTIPEVITCQVTRDRSS